MDLLFIKNNLFIPAELAVVTDAGGGLPVGVGLVVNSSSSSSYSESALNCFNMLLVVTVDRSAASSSVFIFLVAVSMDILIKTAHDPNTNDF